MKTPINLKVHGFIRFVNENPVCYTGKNIKDGVGRDGKGRNRECEFESGDGDTDGRSCWDGMGDGIYYQPAGRYRSDRPEKLDIPDFGICIPAREVHCEVGGRGGTDNCRNLGYGAIDSGNW